MENKKPVEGYYYSKQEWSRVGCGPLPPERDRFKTKDFTAKQKSDIIARGNPPIDNNVVKGYN
jgi:hypothetical protein